jgi:PhnB protein
MQIYPYVKINDGKCREAMNFYKDCLGGELKFMTIADYPIPDDMPKVSPELIMHSELRKDGNLLFSGSDMMRDKAVIGDNVGISINCESEDEINTLYKKLSEGADIFMPIGDVFWGAIFAMFTDKYGVEWMLNYQKK